MIEIRSATIKDLYTIAIFHAESWRTFYRAIWSDAFLDDEVYKERLAVWQHRFNFPPPYQHVFLATKNGNLVGFACLFIDENATYGSLIDNLHVAANSQGIGLGKQLVKTCATACVNFSTNKNLHLWVLEENTKASKFYEHLGGIKVEVINECHPDGSFSNVCRYLWKDVAMLL